MKKPRTTQSTVVSSVYCYEPGCGWSRRVKFADIPAWHKLPCPKCLKGEIVSDGDLVMYDIARTMRALCFGMVTQVALDGVKPIAAKGTTLALEVHFKTRRTGRPA